MAIDLSVLRAAARRSRVEIAASAVDARQRGVRTAFLCHSHKDADYVEGLLVLLREAGWQVYVACARRVSRACAPWSPAVSVLQ